jgi:hypothetical protein
VVHCVKPWQVPPPSVRETTDVRAPSWIESPTDLEITEAKVLLAEICLLKERGLTAEAVVADFVFKNIQPLKDRAYPAYLYSGVTDSTWVTNKRIPIVDLVTRLEMILRGKVSNIGAPVAYSAWNLPPSKSFFDFVSNPPAGDSGLGLRVRPSLEEVEVLVASLGDLPNDEKQVHFEMHMSPGDAEISAMLDMLAEDSSDSVPVETMAVVTIPEPKKIVNTQKLDGTRPKRLCQASHPTAPAEGKKNKKRRLQRVSCLDQDVGPFAPAAEEVIVELFTGAGPNGCGPADAEPNGCGPADADPNGCDPARADPNGCDPVQFIIRIVDEDEEEEAEVPLIRKNSRRYRVSGGSSDIPSPALSALVGLQELSIANFDQALEDVVLEDMLSEPTDGDMMDVCSDIPDVGLELSRATSHASSTLEGGLRSQEVGQGCSIPMEVTESPSALEVAVAENPVLKDGASGCPAPEGVAGNDLAQVGSASCDPTPEGVAGGDSAPMGSAGCNPAPEGVQAGSPSHTSMDVHVGSSPPHEEVALEVSAPDARVLMPAGGAELIPGDVLHIAPVDISSSSHHLASRDLGFPLFFSNLQVIWLFLFWLYSRQITVFVLICFQYQALIDGMAGQLRSQGASVPEGALSLTH